MSNADAEVIEEVKEVFNEDTKRIEEQSVPKEQAEQTETEEIKPKKREMSEERKKQMLENLRKGRETAKRNRELKKQGLLPAKQKTSTKMVIKEEPKPAPVVAPAPNNELNTSILNSLDQLKSELKAMKKLPQSDFQKDEINNLKAEIAELKKASKKNIIKEEDKPKSNLVKPPPSQPINIPQQIPQPVVYSTYSNSIWDKFK